VGEVVSSHVIPRPHEDIDFIIPVVKEEEKPAKSKKKQARKPAAKKTK
jgi:microcompartment protein CcmL/EutN